MKYFTGDVVYFEEYTFRHGVKDKKENRPCVVIYSFIDKEGEKIVVAPLTMSDKAYYIHDGVPITTKLRNRYESFAEVHSLTLHFADEAIDEHERVNVTDRKNILAAIKNLNFISEDYIKVYKYIDYFYMALDIRENLLEEEKKLKSKEEKKAKKLRKQLRNEKRRLCKRFDK